MEPPPAREASRTRLGSAPITQRMALLKNAGALAQRFYEYLQTDATRAALERHGFASPMR